MKFGRAPGRAAVAVSHFRRVPERNFRSGLDRFARVTVRRWAQQLYKRFWRPVIDCERARAVAGKMALLLNRL